MSILDQKATKKGKVNKLFELDLKLKVKDDIECKIGKIKDSFIDITKTES